MNTLTVTAVRRCDYSNDLEIFARAEFAGTKITLLINKKDDDTGLRPRINVGDPIKVDLDAITEQVYTLPQLEYKAETGDIE